MASSSRSSLAPMSVDSDSFSTIVAKLYGTLTSLKLRMRSMKKATVPLGAKDLDDLLFRTQQISSFRLLPTDTAHSNDAISQQLSAMSEKLDVIQSRIPEALPQIPASAIPAQKSSTPLLPTSEARELDMSTAKRHPSLYHEDGNIIISAFALDGTLCLFRIHKSMLEYQSETFAAMLSLPMASQEFYDGAPFVHLPDNAEDLVSLLQIFYHQTALPQKRLNPSTPFLVRGPLALTTKYNMDGMRNCIVDLIKSDWPASLTQWDRLETEIDSLCSEHSEKYDGKIDGLYLDDILPEPVSAIRLAMDFNITNILPAAYYHLSRIDIDSDWTTSRQTALMDDQRTARWKLLRAEDLLHLLQVKNLIAMQLQSEMILSVRPNCGRKGQCPTFLNNSMKEWRLSNDPLQDTKAFSLKNSGICGLCFPSAATLVNTVRNSIWDAVTEYTDSI